MKAKALIIILIIIFSMFLLHENHKRNEVLKIQENIEATKVYADLKKQLKDWSDRFNFIEPRLHLRLNRSSEGFYSRGLITVLSSLEDAVHNPSFLKSIMAHEFAHYYISIKHPEIDPGPNLELLADEVAQELVGPTYQELLKSQYKAPDDFHPSNAQRLKNLQKDKSPILRQ